MHMGRLKANELEPRRMASNLLLALVVGLALVPHSSVLAARPLPRAFTPVPLPAPAGTETTPYPLYTFGANTPGAAQAVCNDGSPVHYAYLPAKDATSRKWMIFLEGGDRCTGFFSCLKRWLEFPRRMSTTYPGALALPAPLAQTPSIELAGVFLDSATHGLAPNPFRENYHQVWVNYCSSDSWTGDGAYIALQNDPVAGNGVEQVITAWGQQLLASPDPAIAAAGAITLLRKSSFLNQFCAGGQCTIRFRGARIVDTLLEDLIRQRGFNNPEKVVLAGSSAGSLGARQNLDRVRGAIQRRWPRTRVLGASDSGHFEAPLAALTPHQPLAALDASCNALPPAVALPTPALLPAVTATGTEFWGGVRVDESCFQSRFGGPRPVPMTQAAFQAADTCLADAQLNASISTPYFIFQGYRDRIYLPSGALNNVTCDSPAGIQHEVTRASHNELLGTGRAAFGVDTSLHTSMQGEMFFNLQRTDPSVSPLPLSHASILWHWLETHGRYNHTILECPPGCAVRCGRQACP